MDHLTHQRDHQLAHSEANWNSNVVPGKQQRTPLNEIEQRLCRSSRINNFLGPASPHAIVDLRLQQGTTSCTAPNGLMIQTGIRDDVACRRSIQNITLQPCLRVQRKSVAEMNLRRFWIIKYQSTYRLSEFAQYFAVLWIAKSTNDLTIQIF